MVHGMIGWGKSGVAKTVQNLLRSAGVKAESLDADEVRANLSPDLTYTIDARDANTKRWVFMSLPLIRNCVSSIVADVRRPQEE